MASELLSLPHENRVEEMDLMILEERRQGDIVPLYKFICGFFKLDRSDLVVTRWQFYGINRLRSTCCKNKISWKADWKRDLLPSECNTHLKSIKLGDWFSFCENRYVQTILVYWMLMLWEMDSVLWVYVLSYRVY